MPLYQTTALRYSLDTNKRQVIHSISTLVWAPNEAMIVKSAQGEVAARNPESVRLGTLIERVEFGKLLKYTLSYAWLNLRSILK